MPNSLEGKILLLHETDFQQTKQLIPDINTWIQCFSVYTAIVVHYFPERATNVHGLHGQTEPEAQVAILGYI